MYRTLRVYVCMSEYVCMYVYKLMLCAVNLDQDFKCMYVCMYVCYLLLFSELRDILAQPLSNGKQGFKPYLSKPTD